MFGARAGAESLNLLMSLSFSHLHEMPKLLIYCWQLKPTSMRFMRYLAAV